MIKSGSLTSRVPDAAPAGGEPRRVNPPIAYTDMATRCDGPGASEIITNFLASATLLKDGGGKWLKRKILLRANVFGKPAAPAKGVLFEIDHVALAAAAGETRPHRPISFRVESVSGGSLQKLDGSEWRAVVAGATTLGKDESLRWRPEIDSGALGGFKVQTLVTTTACPATPAPPRHLFVITNCLADGRIENFIARGDDEEQVQVAAALRESREELRRLSGLLLSIQEDERRRIALDLHDGLGQTLSLVKLAMEQAARLLAEGATEAAGGMLRQVTPRIGDALAEVRRVSAELRPLILDDLGMLPTLSWFFREFRAVSPGIEVETAFDVTEQDVPVRLHLTIYRIIQEAFHNIVKHAAATHVHVRLKRADGMLHLMIEDDGCGFDPASIRCIECQTRGLGLLSMKERALFTGGTYHLKSAAGQGTCIWVSWPFAPAV